MSAFYADRPLIIAHRGASAVAPENTLAAIEAAMEASADGIITDHPARLRRLLGS